MASMGSGRRLGGGTALHGHGNSTLWQSSVQRPFEIRRQMHRSVQLVLNRKQPQGIDKSEAPSTPSSAFPSRSTSIYLRRRYGNRSSD